MPAAREFAQFGIRVNAIAPGIFSTPMLPALPQQAQDSLAASLPFPKKLGDPAQFAALVRHLIENRYLNGEVIRLDAALRMAPDSAFSSSPARSAEEGDHAEHGGGGLRRSSKRCGHRPFHRAPRRPPPPLRGGG